MNAVSVLALKSGHANRLCATFLARAAPSAQLAAAAQSGLWTADPRVVDFHLPMQRLARGIDHRASEFVPAGLISRESQLTLQEQRRHAAFVRHRRSSATSSYCGESSRRSARPGTGTRRPSPMQSRRPDRDADEPVGPATRRQVLLASLFGCELTLELASETKGAPRAYTTYGGLLRISTSEPRTRKARRCLFHLGRVVCG